MISLSFSLTVLNTTVANTFYGQASLPSVEYEKLETKICISKTAKLLNILSS